MDHGIPQSLILGLAGGVLPEDSRCGLPHTFRQIARPSRQAAPDKLAGRFDGVAPILREERLHHAVEVLDRAAGGVPGRAAQHFRP